MDTTHFALWTFGQQLVRNHRHHRRVLAGGHPVRAIERLVRGEVVERRKLNATRGTYELDHGRLQQRRGTDAVFGRLR